MKKKLLFLFIGIFLTYSCFIQFQVETYILDQKEKYNILKHNHRINYYPYIIYLIKGNLFNQKNKWVESKFIFLPYRINKIINFRSNSDFDCYIVYSYFTEADIEKYYSEYYIK